MSYPHPYHFGAPARGTPPTNRRDFASPDQGAVHLSVNIHPHHAYQYAPPANGPNGFHAEQHHAGRGGAPHAHQYYTGSAPQAPYPRLSRELQSLNAFDPALNQGMAGYGPVNASFVEPATHVNYYHNIDPALRFPESSIRSSYSLSAVQDDDWDSESVEDSPDAGRVNSYSLPAIADRASYAPMDSTISRAPETAGFPSQLPTPPSVTPEARASPAPVPAPAPAPEMAPSAVPARPRRTCKSAAAPVPNLTATGADAAGASAAPAPAPSSAHAKGKGKGKKRARADSPAPAASAKRSRRAEPEATIVPEASPSVALEAEPSSAPGAGSSAALDVVFAAAAAATIERSPTPEDKLRCRWDNCEKLIGTQKGVFGRHLRRAHFANDGAKAGAEGLKNTQSLRSAKKNKTKTKEDEVKLTCKWAGGCGADPMGKPSMQRHITAVHASLERTPCPKCEKSTCRGDALKRHLLTCCLCADCGVKFGKLEDYNDHACPGPSAGPSGSSGQ